MDIIDIIQLFTLIVFAVSVVILVIQTRIQNRLLRAQLLRDRLEMYWETYQPVTDDHVRDFIDYPEDYMNKELFEKRYSGKTQNIRRYIYMSMLYEYLAFTYSLKTSSVGDPLGYQWTQSWTRDLLQSPQFHDVHEQYRGYYPKYEAFVDDILRKYSVNTSNPINNPKPSDGKYAEKSRNIV
jgi:hypothetical protein